MYVFNKGQFSNHFLNSMTKFMYIYCKKCPNLRVKCGAKCVEITHIFPAGMEPIYVIFDVCGGPKQQ